MMISEMSNSTIQKKIESFTSDAFQRSLLHERFIEGKTYEELGIIHIPGHTVDNDLKVIRSFEKFMNN